jgi:tripartite-type tricarboxylate transporter receptor subunit TctC
MARDLETFSKTEDLRAKLATQVAVPDFARPGAFAERIRTELATWRKVAQRAGIRPE